MHKAETIFFYITKVLVMDAKTYSELENPFHNMFYLGNETGRELNTRPGLDPYPRQNREQT